MIEITLMNESHLPGAIEIERECFADPWSLDMLRGDLEHQGSLYLAAIDNGKSNGQLIGYAGMMRILDEGHIHNVAVTLAYRKMGVGRMLISELTARSREAGLRRIFLEVRPGNQAAIALYDGLGFGVIGRRPRYYQNPVEDALLMALEL